MMELAAPLAQEIVTQMKEIIHQEINFMNKQAIIMASTDPDRIGEMHGGAKEVIKTKSPLTIATDYSYPGSKKGINIPIYFEQEIIGVIGITGDKEKVQQHGEIIKKMTEILIKEDYLKDILSKQRDRSRHIISALLHQEISNKATDTPDPFSYDYSIPHVAVIGKCTSIPLDSRNDLHKIIEQSAILDYKHIFTILSDQLYILFREETTSNVQHILRQLVDEIHSKTTLTFRFGIGLRAESQKEARQSFIQAADALKWTNLSNHTLELYQEMNSGILYAGLSEEKAAHYFHKILSRIPSDDKEELKLLFFTYGETNKSMAKSAEKLFLHKNTFQYKLNKIQHYTGYDPKVVNDYVVLYSAFVLESLSDSTIT